MAEDYFDQLLELAAEIVSLVDAESTLDKSQWKEAKTRHDAAVARFNEVRGKYVDALLKTADGRENGPTIVEQQIAEIKGSCDPSWVPALDYISEHFTPYFRKQEARHPKVRSAIKAMPYALGGVALLAYFVIRFVCATPITDKLESKSGIQQRAAAVEKVIRYDEWMATHVRKGGWLKGLLLWPIEPTEDEIKGAAEYAGLAFEAQKISVEQFGCSVIPRGYGEAPSKEEIKYLSASAEYLRNPATRWDKSAPLTTVQAARAIGHC